MNALKNRTFQLASGLLALGAIGLLTPRVAHAVVATLVQVANTTTNPVPNQDVDNSARNFYQSTAFLECSGACDLTFPAVPTGKRLIVQQVSSLITFAVSGAVPPVYVQSRDSTNLQVFQFLPVVAALSNSSNQSESVFVAHDAVLASFDAGEVPNVRVTVPSSQGYDFQATISGHMINLP